MGLSKSKSSSTNQAYDSLSKSLSPVVGAAGTGASGISDFLSGNTAGFDKFKVNTGFNQELSNGLGGVTEAGAARGLLNSGATGKAYMNYGQQLEQRSAGDYIKSLLGLGGLGIQAGGVLGGAGQTSKSSSKSIQAPTPGWGG